MIDYNDIKQSIAENLPDNNRREITAAKLRDTLDGFVDKVQVTEAGLEGKVSANETNIGNLSGRMDTNEANVTNLTGRVDSLSGEVSGLSGTVGNLSGEVSGLSGEVSGLSGRVDDLSGSIGNVPRIVYNPIKGGANDVASVKWDTIISAVSGVGTARSKESNVIDHKVFAVDGSYINKDGAMVQQDGCSYFEHTSFFNNGYVTVPACNGGAQIAPDGNPIYPAFYDKDGNFIRVEIDTFAWWNTDQLELKVPYGAAKLRVSLINGTFDPNNLSVIDSKQPSNYSQQSNLRKNLNEHIPTVDYLAKIGADGMPVIDGLNRVSVVKLLAGDELEMEIGGIGGVQLAVSDSNKIEVAKTVIYPENISTDVVGAMIYYKADRDCYAFMSEPACFKVIHNDRFAGDMQYEMMALMNKIRPFPGQIWEDSEGKGMFKPGSYSGVGGGISVVFKVPVLAGTTQYYVLNTSGYTVDGSGYGGANYWYSGQPTPTASVETHDTYNTGYKKITINNSTSNKSGYALLPFTIKGIISGSDLLNSVYLEKVDK